MIKEIPPQQAWDLLKSNANATLLDVRSSVEYYYVGHPCGAIHIPYKEAPDWETDKNFAEKVLSGLINKGNKGNKANKAEIIVLQPVLIICRSGKRSMEAAEELNRHGFKEIYNILEGFEGDRDENNHRSTINGWRFHNLPWEQT
jgi:rhodanese-related sulfurtransferase